MRIKGKFIPWRYTTANQTSVDDGKTWRVVFSNWWMMFGRCYKVRQREV